MSADDYAKFKQQYEVIDRRV